MHGNGDGKEKRDTGSETACERHMRCDVAISAPFTTQQIHPIPKNLQPIAFEKQLSDIDAAIVGGALIPEKFSSPD